jgi:hypothetical protein
MLYDFDWRKGEKFILCKQMAGTLNDLLKATSRSFYLIPHCGTGKLALRSVDIIVCESRGHSGFRFKNSVESTPIRAACP